MVINQGINGVSMASLTDDVEVVPTAFAWQFLQIICQTKAMAARSARNLKVVEAAGVEPASLANKPAATTCLVRREFSSVR